MTNQSWVTGQKSAIQFLMNTYALVCPTRGRPGRLLEFTESAIKTADRPDRLEFLLYVDDDDPTLAEYEKAVASLKNNFPGMAISLTIGPAIGVPRAVDKLVTQTSADIFMTANDDQVYIDKGWDSRLDLEIAEFPDGIFCMWFNDGWEAGNFCTFPVLSRTWIETLGYLQFPFFEHYFADAWIWMLAKAVGRDHYIDDVLVEHRHWKTGKSDMDATYERHATGPENSPEDFRHARDRAVIDKFERYFLADVGALKSAMSSS